MFEKAQNEKNKATYDFTTLWSTQFFGFYQFKNFLEFASDQSVQIDYLKSRDVIWGNENGEGHDIMPLRYNKDKRKNPVFSRVSAFVVAYSIPFPTLIVNEKSVE